MAVRRTAYLCPKSSRSLLVPGGLRSADESTQSRRPPRGRRLAAMDLVTRFALVCLVCAFVLNAVVTIQNFEKDKAINAIGDVVDLLRLDLKKESDARATKDRATDTLITQNEACVLAI